MMFHSGTPSFSTDDTLESVRAYAASLLATVPNAKGKLRDDTVCADSPSTRNKSDAETQQSPRVEKDGECADEGGLTGCREAVELLTRNQKKGEVNPLFFTLSWTECIDDKFHTMLLRKG